MPFHFRRWAALVLLMTACASAVVAEAQAPLTQVMETRLPGVDGDFDHFAYDLKRGWLFSAAEENHTLEVFDLKTGAHLRSIAGFKAPHTLAYVPETDKIFVTDGEDASCIILSAKDMHRVDRIPLRPGADSGVYDPAAKRFYIGNGGREEKRKDSVISIISVVDHKKVGEIPIDGDNIEAMTIDQGHHRMFVNIRDRKQIGVVDLETNRVVGTWVTPDMNRNTAMALDVTTQRLFVSGRTPGRLYVFDTAKGELVKELDAVDNSDDLSWDPAMSRIYVTGSQGISVFHQDSADFYRLFANMKTIGGKTSIFVPELKRLYVAHPKSGNIDASTLVYRANP